MSYIIGWKNSRSVFLSGDSLLTANFKSPQIDKVSSFGEELKDNENIIHSENYLKIWVIGKLAVGFVSNDTYEAIHFLDYLTDAIDQDKILESIKIVVETLIPKESSFLFAFNENNDNWLFKYDPDYGELQEEDEPTQIGSLPSEYMDQSYELCEEISEQENELSDDDSIVLANSIHQNLMIVQNSMKFDVGGLFTGLYINETGVCWQKDTFYINYLTNLDLLKSDHSNLSEVFIPYSQIQLIIRQNTASFSNGFNHDESGKRDNLFKCWISYDKTQLPKSIIDERLKWVKESSDEINEKFNCPEPDYIVLFSNDNKIPRGTVIIRSFNGNPFLKIPCMKDNYFDIDVNMAIIESLLPDNDEDVYKYEFIN